MNDNNQWCEVHRGNCDIVVPVLWDDDDDHPVMACLECLKVRKHSGGVVIAGRLPHRWLWARAAEGEELPDIMVAANLKVAPATRGREGKQMFSLRMTPKQAQFLRCLGYEVHDAGEVG